MGQNLIDFRNFIKSERLNQLTKGISEGLGHGLSDYLGTYEKKVRKIVKELDLKSRDARKKSGEQLDRFTNQLKSTRGEFEKRVVTLVNHEAERLNKGFNDLVSYLKTLSKQEAALKAKGKGKKAGAKKSASSKKSAAARAPRKKASAETSASVN